MNEKELGEAIAAMFPPVEEKPSGYDCMVLGSPEHFRKKRNKITNKSVKELWEAVKARAGDSQLKLYDLKIDVDSIMIEAESIASTHRDKIWGKMKTNRDKS